MTVSPVNIWRQQKIQRKLLGKTGKVIQLTNLSGEANYSGIVRVGKEKIVTQIIANFHTPKVNDQVIGVLRISNKNGQKGIIEYGIKFQLKEECYL